MHDPFLVGGHSVSDVRMWFVYGCTDDSILREKEDSSLYMTRYTFSVMDTMSAYKDLKAKMNLIYGEGKEVTKQTESSSWSTGADGDLVRTDYTCDKRTTTWKGVGNTCVKLEGSASTRPIEEDYWNHYLTLVYGKIDKDEQISKVEALVKAEKLKEELDNYSPDIDGLCI